MKKLVKVALVAGCIMLTCGFAKAQTKIGYINFGNLVSQTTEIKAIQSQMDAYQKSFIDEIQKMQGTLQAQASDYDAKKATMTDAVRTKTENELQDLNKRIQDYQNTASQQVQAKSNELTKPLFDKLRAAISQVAKEKGYTYVIDTSQVDLLVSPAGDDLMNAVKAKLNIGGTPAAAKK